MKKLHLFLLIGLFALTSCRQEGEVLINFKPVFQSDPLVLNQEYTLGDLDIKFENLNFFLTDIAIVNAKGETVALSDAELIEFNGNPSDGVTLNYTSIPGGKYEKLTFNIGVTEDLNSTRPGDYDITEPLARSDMYWEAWGSYIFSKTEGSADPDKDRNYDLKWFYHTGSDELNRAFELEQDFVIDDDQSFTFEFALDYDRLLRDDAGIPLDIPSKPRNHNADDIEIITHIVNNYSNALSIKI